MEKDKYLLPIMLLFIGGIGLFLWNKNNSKSQTKSTETNSGGGTQQIIIEKSTEANTGTVKPAPYSPSTGRLAGIDTTPSSSKPTIATNTNPTSMNADGNTYYTKYNDVL